MGASGRLAACRLAADRSQPSSAARRSSSAATSALLALPAPTARPGGTPLTGRRTTPRPAGGTRSPTAPRVVPAFAPSAVIGTAVYIRAGADLLTYDAPANRWTRTALTGPTDWYDLVADGPRLTARLPGSDENAQLPRPRARHSHRCLDPAAGGPAGSRPSTGSITPTDTGLVLTAQAIGPEDQPVDPALVQAALLPRGLEPLAATRPRATSSAAAVGRGRARVWWTRRSEAPTAVRSTATADTIPFGGATRPDLRQRGHICRTRPRRRTGGWVRGGAGRSADRDRGLALRRPCWPAGSG